MITAQDLYEALCETDDLEAEFFRGFITKVDGLNDVLVDGHFDLEAMAEILNRKSVSADQGDHK